MISEQKSSAHLLIFEGGKFYLIFEGKKYTIIQKPMDDDPTCEDIGCSVVGGIGFSRALIYSDMGDEKVIFESDIDDAIENSASIFCGDIDRLEDELVDVAWFF